MRRIQCANCGGAIELAEGINFGKCPFCDEIYDLVDNRVEVSGQVSVNGIETVESILERAYQLVQDNRFDSSIKLYNKVLSLEPNNHHALWGLFICKLTNASYYGFADKYGNSGPQVTQNIMYDLIGRYANRAIDNAPEEKKNEYRSFVSDVMEDLTKPVQNEPRKKEGCYIATAVYGSYHSYEVVLLRMYRDKVLKKHLLGRIFIKIYYTLSPKLSKYFGSINALNNWTRKKLNRIMPYVETHIVGNIHD